MILPVLQSSKPRPGAPVTFPGAHCGEGVPGSPGSIPQVTVQLKLLMPFPSLGRSFLGDGTAGCRGMVWGGGVSPLAPKLSLKNKARPQWAGQGGHTRAARRGSLPPSQAPPHPPPIKMQQDLLGIKGSFRRALAPRAWLSQLGNGSLHSRAPSWETKSPPVSPDAAAW